MLLYRPLLTAYQGTEVAQLRRYLLRELAYPLLHSEPDETLQVIQRASRDTLHAEPARLMAEISLMEQLMQLRLTTRDPAREAGGLWTSVGMSRPVGGWNRAPTPTDLTAIASQSLSQFAQPLLKQVDEDSQARALAALGDLGSPATLNALADALATGPAPSGAAVGLARMGTAEAEAAVFRAVQGRGFEKAVPWIGLALGRLASPNNVPLVGRLARASQPELREQAAIALEGFGSHDVGSLLELFRAEQDRFVRLHLLLSIGRLSPALPAEQVVPYWRAGDPDLIRVAAVRAVARSGGDTAREFLEGRATAGTPAERAEAIEGLVTLGAPGAGLLEEARKATAAAQVRLSLSGLLALAVWAPEEAIVRARQFFDEAQAARWSVATYALRYIHTDQTSVLLTQLLKHVRGSEIEEIAVSALSRHLHKPGVLEALLSRVNADAPPLIVSRILEDLARHLTAELAEVAAQHVRDQLRPGLDPRLAVPMLASLGSLGTAQDLPLLESFLTTPAVVGALRGMELFMDPETGPAIEQVLKGGPDETREAAAVALYRLGLPAGEKYLEEITGGRRADVLASATRILSQMALSVRSLDAVPRLARLRAMLLQRQQELANQPPPVAKPGKKPMPKDEDSGVREVLSRARPTKRVGAVAKPTKEVPVPAGKSLYRELGKHLFGEGMAEGSKLGTLVPVFLAFVGLYIFLYMIGFLDDPAPPKPDGAPPSAHSSR